MNVEAYSMIFSLVHSVQFPNRAELVVPDINNHLVPFTPPGFQSEHLELSFHVTWRAQFA